MKTVKNILQQLTDAKTILRELRDALRVMDPEFFDTEVKYLAAVAKLEKELGDRITPCVSEFLAAEEEAFATELIYIGWQGFQLNMDIFLAPSNARLLQGDFEELHRERHLKTLPMAKKARDTINDFYKAMRELCEDKLELTEDIAGFYSYLQTAGYKLAHYFGFRLADLFLPYIIPGYMDNDVNTGYYRRTLQEYLDMDISRMEQ